jgi:hypothetical protein
MSSSRLYGCKNYDGRGIVEEIVKKLSRRKLEIFFWVIARGGV